MTETGIHDAGALRIACKNSMKNLLPVLINCCLKNGLRDILMIDEEFKKIPRGII